MSIYYEWYMYEGKTFSTCRLKFLFRHICILCLLLKTSFYYGYRLLFSYIVQSLLKLFIISYDFEDDHFNDLNFY